MEPSARSGPTVTENREGLQKIIIFCNWWRDTVHKHMKMYFTVQGQWTSNPGMYTGVPLNVPLSTH